MLRTFHLQIEPQDWQTIQHDESYEIEVPAALRLEDEWPMIVSVRRKSGDPLTESNDFIKVSLKIDVNAIYDGQTWHGLKKISLENGDDQDVVSEGFAWWLHSQAAGHEGYGYHPGYGSWVRLYINDIYTGVYLSAEQRDKQFLRNRDLYTAGETWLYKMGDIGSVELKVGENDSPTYQELCFAPFRSGGDACPPLSYSELAALLPQWIDMKGMIALGVVNTYVANPDELWNHGKNCYFADFLSGPRRMYFPWDLDSSRSGGHDGIIPSGSPYADILMGVPEFYDQYMQILNALLHGPLSMQRQLTFLDQLEPILTEALAADPNSKMDGNVAGHFDGIRNWVVGRFEDFEPLLDEPTNVDLAYPEIRLDQNYPNPFNPKTSIPFTLEKAGVVSLSIHDTGGRLVRTLIEKEVLDSGKHRANWDGTNDRGQAVPSGVYCYSLASGSFSSTHRMILLK
ncbi:CotH kinase family protein [bacterium]|nr:CotH kinase family protein [bacterium]